MIKHSLIAVSALTLAALPSAAGAQYYPGDPYYGGYNGQTYYGNRCSGTTGTIVGGLAGAYVGSKVIAGRRSYDYYGNRRASRNTTGALLGGAVGALLGRKVDKDACNRRNSGGYGYRY